ncbi:hypothetical protein C943_01064 [Mariniradius saccharolyticus AK6]|uniref:Uncharacterized protein n=1 Tax=Mariniradius saccharolyticus AK6 TaxID=1239962 RepID=M7XV32_9BACT|nr:hypothetical protein C943_01064 [Mariniradius saccharolyticus AK6]
MVFETRYNHNDKGFFCFLLLTFSIGKQKVKKGFSKRKSQKNMAKIVLENTPNNIFEID